MVMREKLEELLNWRKLGLDIGAVLDTSFLVDRVTDKLWTLPVALFLKGTMCITPGGAEKEYINHYETKALNDEGVPKAPVPMERISLDGVIAFADIEEAKLPKNIIEHKQMSNPDVEIIQSAVYFAQETGKEVYLVTNDTAIIGSVKSNLSNNNIYLIMPSLVEEYLSGLIHELGLQLLIQSKVLGQLYKLGKDGIEKGIMPYIVVERNQEFQYGKDALNIDIATDVAFVENGKSIPATTKSYGILVTTVTLDNREEIDNVFTSISPYLHGKKKLWGILPQEYSFMPTIYRATTDSNIVKKSLDNLDNEVKQIEGVPQSLVDKKRRELKKILTTADSIRWASI